MTSILILLLSALMFAGCCHGESSYSQNVEILDIERALDNISDIKLSKYASEIKYIPLSFDSEALLGNIGRVILTDEHFYFKSSSLFNSTILKFTKNGKFASQVGKYGRGPGEVANANRFFVTHLNGGQECVGICDLKHNLLIYNSKNECLNNFSSKTIEAKTNCQVVSDVGALGGNLYYLLARNSPDQSVADEILFIVDSDLDIVSQKNLGKVSTRKSTIKFSESDAKRLKLSSSTVHYDKPYSSYIWKFNDDLRIVKGQGDTIYSFKNVYNNHSLSHKKAIYVIDYGKYRLNYNLENSDDKPVIFLAEKSLESGSFVILGFRFQSSDFECFILYDKTEDKTYAIKSDSKSGDIGFINDLDNGIVFWPVAVYDNKMYQLVNAIDFIEVAEKSTSAKMKEVAAQLTEESNPVVVEVTLK